LKHFFHTVSIEVWSGKGGNGIASFERKRFKPKGGPNGGDGGRGGSVIVKMDPSKSSLTHLKSFPIQKAGAGAQGMSDRKHGKSGKDLVLLVPENTAVFDDLGAKLADITKQNESFVLLKGGRGGFGNVHFKSSRNQAPSFALEGGDPLSIKITLKLTSIADILILGNASELLQKVHTEITNEENKANYAPGHPTFSTHTEQWQTLKTMLFIFDHTTPAARYIQDYIAGVSLVVWCFSLYSYEIFEESLLRLRNIQYSNAPKPRFLIIELPDSTRLEDFYSWIGRFSNRSEKSLEKTKNTSKRMTLAKDYLSDLFSMPEGHIEINEAGDASPSFLQEEIRYVIKENIVATHDSW